MLEISINMCFELTFLTYEDKVTNLKCFNMILAYTLRNYCIPYVNTLIIFVADSWMTDE